MPLKLNRRNRRRLVKRKRTFRKSRPGRALATTKVLNTTRYYDLTGSTAFTHGDALTVGAGFLCHTTSATFPNVNYGSFGAFFRASDLPDIAEYQNMFEQYRINKVTVKIIPMATEASSAAAASGTATQSAVFFHWCLDYDDAARPTASLAGINALRQRTGYKLRNIYSGNGKPITVTFTPKVLEDVYRSSISTGYKPVKGGWIDEGYPDVPHYGLKCITESICSGTALLHFFKVETRLHLSLKGMQ